MVFIEKEELLEAIKRRYGDLDCDCGCSCSSGDGWVWLSIKRIVEIVENCQTYED